MPASWTAESLSQIVRSFQPTCVLLAAAELDLFTILSAKPLSAHDVARIAAADPRAMRTLLDALAAMGLLIKTGELYRPAPGTLDVLTHSGQATQLAMAQHQMNCLRNWAQLARVVKTGKPARREPSIRGEAADYASFIEAMNNVSGPAAQPLVESMPELKFKHLLDVGGGSGTWTIAFLRRYPHAAATLFDLPQVIPQAQQRLSQAGVADRVRLVGGDFNVDPLPPGADLAWVGAIVHQNSRQQNQRLFKSIAQALPAGGQILIRDFVMDDSRVQPAAGTMFAVNMLVATEGGGTFTFPELCEDLALAGFQAARLLRNDGTMNSLLLAQKRE
jgi:SAM-dependent methyltransferase